jgi:hypothetical protein
VKFIAVSFFFAAMAAHAHVEPGVYRGVDDQGAACSMTAGATTFENGFHHPLSERFAITVGGDSFSAGHPSDVDAQSGSITFNHDLVQGTLPTPVGAKAVVITMEHSQKFEGPTEFTYIDHNWKTKAKSVVHCKEIRWQSAQ